MPENLEKNIDIMVVKRDGKKVPFDGSKIALAIKKGFDSVYTEDEETHKYIDKDMYKIYNKVIEKIEKLKNEKIKIEEIQDLIEEQLKLNGYEDVYESFKAYRDRRNQSRQVFFDEKKQHKFLKALEDDFPGAETEKDEIEFKVPSKVFVQMDGEGGWVDGVSMVELEKVGVGLRVIRK